MDIENGPAPWGQKSFDRERNWYGHLPSGGWDSDEIKKEYQELRQRALDDPEFDLFDEFMPTGRPKHDIGRYVMRYGVNVPLIGSMQEWQSSLMMGTALLRSELRQDYAGFSGVLRSEIMPVRDSIPTSEDQPYGREYIRSEEHWGLVERRTVEGPPKREIDLGEVDELWLGSTAVNAALNEIIAKGLYEGTVDPAAIMKHLWRRDIESMRRDAAARRYRPRNISINAAQVSRWRYVPGVNVRIFRDPVVEGKYFIGGQAAHHHWEVTEGLDSPDVGAYDKSVYRGYRPAENPEYVLPTSKIITLYEKVRTLPYFDQRQAPMMEMQYGDDGKLHFLQYLKTRQLINDPGEFALPSGDNIVTVHDVRGATKPEGEKLRIYLDPRVFTRNMWEQGFFVDFDMTLGGGQAEQVASLMSKVMILDYSLCFKDNHFSSAPLVRAPVALGLYDGVGEAHKRFAEVSTKQPFRDAWHKDSEVEYIDSIVTSNGRKATIESDWEMKSEKLN